MHSHRTGVKFSEIKDFRSEVQSSRGTRNKEGGWSIENAGHKPHQVLSMVENSPRATLEVELQLHIQELMRYVLF